MTRQIAWQPQPGPQTSFVRCPAFEVLYGGAVGGGKVICDNELVVTPFGYRPHGDLKVGDTICAADGTPTKIIHVSERQIQPMHRVTFDDGSTVVAGRDHLWNYSVATKGKWRKSGRYWKVGTTEQMIEMMDSGRKILIPMCKPVKFTKSYKPDHNPRRIDPYVLGALLGDGHMGHDQVTLTSADTEIAERVVETGDWRSHRRDDNVAISYAARGQTRIDLIDALERLDLYGKNAHEKFIPQPYMWGTVEARFELLRGLMDTDGYIDERGQAYYTSVSEQLAKDVRWLVFSLGGRARITDRVPTYTHDGEKKEGRTAYTVTIRMPDNRDIVYLRRKRDRANAWRENGVGELKRRIASIEYVEDQECHCIVVDHPDSLYLVGDFIVTHNSDGLLGDFADGIEEYGGAWRGIYFRRHFPDMDDIIARSREIFGPVYGDKCYNASKFTWNFPSGANLRFRALEKDDDVYKYQGQAFAWVGWDELTQWPTPFPYTFIMTRARSAKGAPVRIRAATNPGGIGHHWVKARFIDSALPNVPRAIETRSGDIYYRVFIPAQLEDNQILMKADPAYADRIFELHDERYAEALRYGDWNIVAGAAFTEWRQHIHVIPNAPIPLDKRIYRTLDWGFKSPYANHWAFQDNDANVIICGELYGYGGGPNIGSEEAPEVVREKILAWERGWDIPPTRGWIDPSTAEEHDGKDTVFRRLGGKRMWKAWPKGSNSRVTQKQLFHQFLSVTNDKSRLMFMERCAHAIRTIPTLPTDKINREDIDTKAEDHCYDDVRGLLAAKFMPSKEQVAMQRARRRIARSEMFLDQPDCGGF